MAAKEKNLVPSSASDEAKQEALKRALNALNKEFGRGTIMKMGEKPNIQVDVVSTGILELDFALGVGGIPRGRIVEVYGPEASGKTTVSLHMIAQVQKAGGIAAFIDAEHALDPVYARNLGVDIDELYVSQPSTGETPLKFARRLFVRAPWTLWSSTPWPPLCQGLKLRATSAPVSWAFRPA